MFALFGTRKHQKTLGETMFFLLSLDPEKTKKQRNELLPAEGRMQRDPGRSGGFLWRFETHPFESSPDEPAIFPRS